MAAKSDKLHQRKKAIGKKGFARSPAKKDPLKRILVVCEGELTEPNYFEAFKVHAKLSNVDIDIRGKECGAAPISVVNYAEEKANAEGHYKSGGYDHVFCVFDEDTHTCFHKAMSKVQDLKKSRKFLAKNIECIPSYPSFEVWLLFHFTYTRTPFSKTGNRSPAQMVTSRLKATSKLFSSFEKALSVQQCNALYELTDTAIKNSEQAEKDYRETGDINPSTKIHHMIKTLLS